MSAFLPVLRFTILSLATLMVAMPYTLFAAEITSYSVSFRETENGECYKDYQGGGRLEDGCPVQLEISLITHPGALEIGQSGIPTAQDVMAMAQTASAYPGIRIIVPGIAYGGSYNGAARMRDKRGSNDRCMFTEGVTGIDCFDGNVSITEFTPLRLAGSFSGTLYKLNNDQKTFSSTPTSGSFDIPMPALHDSRRPAGITYQEQFRQAFNLWYHTRAERALADRLRSMRDDEAGGAASGPPCDCSCELHLRWQNWQIGRSCAPNCLLPEWDGRQCHVECRAAWASCPNLAQPSENLPADTRRLVEAMAQQQGAQWPAEYRAIEDLIARMSPEQVGQMRQLHGTSGSGQSTPDVEEILDHMLGKSSAEGTRAAMRPSIEAMPPEDRAELLRTYRESAGASTVDDLSLPPETQQIADSTGAVAAGQIDVNPDWDAETLRYKAAVEQLGLPPDMTEDAVEMFFNNEAPMRQRLWQNVREQLSKKGL